MYSERHLRCHRYEGLAPGPRLIVTGAVHGNETCGTQAIERVRAELDTGRLDIQRGVLSLVPVCNPLAYRHARRAGDRNLNRRLRPTQAPLDYEDGVANVLCGWLRNHDVLLDLHSFRGDGVPFALRGPVDNDGPLEPFAHEAAEGRLAAHLGVGRVVDGWMAVYAAGVERRRAWATRIGRSLQPDLLDVSYGVGTTEYMRSAGGYGVTLECGPHDDPHAPEVAYAAIRQAIALLGLADLPLAPPHPAIECLSLADVVDRLHGGDRFVRPWASFDAVAAGEVVALRVDGTEVRAPDAGRIVFPDVAAEPGHEWFYLAAASGRTL